jgi:hypothetical protein
MWINHFYYKLFLIIEIVLNVQYVWFWNGTITQDRYNIFIKVVVYVMIVFFYTKKNTIITYTTTMT